MFILVPAHPGSLGQRAVKWLCLCVWVYAEEDWGVLANTNSSGLKGKWPLKCDIVFIFTNTVRMVMMITALETVIYDEQN